MNKTSLRTGLKLPQANSEIEKFQNEVLRPILKLQNELLISKFKHYINKHNIQLKTIEEELRTQIINICQKESSLKNQYIGMIIGMFESFELEIYHHDITIYNKRITSMISQRIFDNLVKH